LHWRTSFWKCLFSAPSSLSSLRSASGTSSNALSSVNKTLPSPQQIKCSPIKCYVAWKMLRPRRANAPPVLLSSRGVIRRESAHSSDVWLGAATVDRFQTPIFLQRVYSHYEPTSKVHDAGTRSRRRAPRSRAPSN
jgi:hypothetical protein